MYIYILAQGLAVMSSSDSLPGARGGARAKPSQRSHVESSQLQAFCNRLLDEADKSTDPFDFLCYNSMQIQKAVKAQALWELRDTLQLYVTTVSSACYVPVKQFTDVLFGMAQTDAFKQFPGTIWEGVNPCDAAQLHIWCTRCVNKLVVIMAHLRRIRTSEVKQIQAFRPLQQHERQDLTALLASIVGVEDCDCSASLFDHSFGQKCVSHLFSVWVC